MAVKIRLARRGRKQRPFYHIVVADARSPRDGKFIEQIGSYNPMTKPATIELDRDKAYDWLTKGAQPTDTARAILRFKGVMYKKHLQRGVKKGALTQEQADEMVAKWIEAKESKVAERREETAKELADFRKMLSGEAKPKEIVADTEAADAFRAGAEEGEAKPEELVADTEAADAFRPGANEEVAEVAEAPVEEEAAKVAEAPVAAAEEE